MGAAIASLESLESLEPEKRDAMAAAKKTTRVAESEPAPQAAPAAKVKTGRKAGRTAKAPKPPTVKKGQIWEDTREGVSRRGRVTGFDTAKVSRLAILEPVAGMTKTSRIAVTTLQTRWKLVPGL